MHEQGIIDTILLNIDRDDCKLYTISLICDADTLTQRIQKDITLGIRKQDVLERSISRLGMYDRLDTVKVDTKGKSIKEIVDHIVEL